jgi:hypothetical protein
MSVYKHFNQINIAKALGRTFSLHQGTAWMNEPAVIHLTLRYFPLPEFGSTFKQAFNQMYREVCEVLLTQVKEGKVIFNQNRYRKVQAVA